MRDTLGLQSEGEQVWMAAEARPRQESTNGSSIAATEPITGQESEKKTRNTEKGDNTRESSRLLLAGRNLRKMSR